MSRPNYNKLRKWRHRTKARNTKENKLRKWLDHLQQDSWQLELLISGFAIFLLFEAYGPLLALGERLMGLSSEPGPRTLIGVLTIIFITAWFFLVLNLLLHLLMRTLWIASIGLRSVSGDIDYQFLHLRPKFERFLRSKIGSFDQYIERLEKICSTIFAFTFLIIFGLIAVGIFSPLIYFFSFYLPGQTDGWVRVLAGIFNVFFLFTLFMYAADFFSRSDFKQSGWLEKLYFPFYRFYGWLTLAFLYRPLYYNLIDNKFGRWAGILLLPYMFITVFFFSLELPVKGYIPQEGGPWMIKAVSYQEEISGGASLPPRIRISSKLVSSGFLEVYLPYSPVVDKEILESICPGFAPFKNRVQVSGGPLPLRTSYRITLWASESEKKVISEERALDCFRQMYRMHIDDSLYTEYSFHFYQDPKPIRQGLQAMIDVLSLERGEHLLRVSRRLVDLPDGLGWEDVAFIPFWKE